MVEVTQWISARAATALSSQFSECGCISHIVVLVAMIILTCQPYDEEMTSAAIIEDVKRKLEAKEMEKRQANSDTWNKLDNYQEQMLLRRWAYRTDAHALAF